MSRKAIVLGVAILFAGAFAAPTTAKEPGGLWKAWCGWLDSCGFRRDPSSLARIGSPAARNRLDYYEGGPYRPVDYSFDDLVDQP